MGKIVIQSNFQYWQNKAPPLYPKIAKLYKIINKYMMKYKYFYKIILAKYGKEKGKIVTPISHELG